MSGVYRTICADPPWRYSTTTPVTGNAPGRTKQKGRSGTDYGTMSIEEIAALPVADWADPTGAHLYLWTTNTHVEHSWDIARAWGFTPKNLLTWSKPPKGMIGFGVFSQSSEFVLFATVGESVNLDRCERTVFEYPRMAHSAKPEAFLDEVERLSPEPRLEMFARRARFGWDYYGDESLETAQMHRMDMFTPDEEDEK